MLEFPSVTYRWDDWDVSFAGGMEFPFVVLSYIHIHCVEMAICIVDAYIPYSFSSLGVLVMEVCPQI